MNEPVQETGPARAMDVHILTLFPEFFSALTVSVLGRARDRGLWRYEAVDIRSFATDKHKTADDTPYGGGAGMVMKPGPVVEAIEDVQRRRATGGLPPACVVALTPSGEVFSQAVARELSQRDALVLVCGRYEGFDERALTWVDRQISLGDFVMTGGEPAALAMIDAIVRLIPGVLGNAESAEDESFAAGLLEYPHYTRPADFRGMGVPDVLTSGDHGKIARWRRAMALLRTLERRPDLLEGLTLDDDARRMLEEARAWRDEQSGGNSAQEGE